MASSGDGGGRCGGAGHRTDDDGEGRHSKRSSDAGDCPDEDYIYDDDGDGEIQSGYSSGDEDYLDQAEEKKVADGAAAEKRYVVLTEDGIRARQAEDTAKVAEILSIPPGYVAVLLRHFKWRAGHLQGEWFSDEGRVRAAAGLPEDGAPVPLATNAGPLACGICFDVFDAGRMLSVGCSHFYCRACWRGYISAAADDGARCVALRCPDPVCSAPVLRELVDVAAATGDKDRYARFLLRSYVEDSGGRIKWCPAPGCTCAVEFLGCAGDAADVFCVCRQGFCFHCGEEAHRPVSCDTVREWLTKNISDSSETTNWVLANTKLCPKCRRPIEKNQGCNRMTCGASCGHRFCWICLDPLVKHRGCSSFQQQEDDKVDGAGGKLTRSKNDARRRQEAKASIGRYLYHFERWAANRESLISVHKDMEKLERSGLKEMAAAAGVKEEELGFLTEAYEQIADGRRVLRWAHAYGYYLDPARDGKKRELFDELQSQANSWLERLHGCAELERKELFGAKEGESAIDAELEGDELFSAEEGESAIDAELEGKELFGAKEGEAAIDAKLEGKELFGAKEGDAAVDAETSKTIDGAKEGQAAIDAKTSKTIDAETFKTFKKKVVNLTQVTGTFMENLVKAFETDLPDVYAKNF